MIGIQNPAARTDALLWRVLPDGTFDSTFGRGGLSAVDLKADVARLRALKIQTDGKIILAGEADGNLAVARLLP